MGVGNCSETITPNIRQCGILRETDIWTTGPNTWGIIIYSVIIPIIATLGIVGNVLILAVLGSKSLKASTYTYLTVLAGADLLNCILLILSGLSKGIFWGKSGWAEFDAFVEIPMCSITSNVATLATAGVTLDRLVLVSGPLRCKPPKFCDSRLARKIIWCALPIIFICNIPHFFIYKTTENGGIATTDFYKSRFYSLNNWMQFCIFGLIPGVFLLIGNAILLYSVGKAIEKRRNLMAKHIREAKCVREQARLTTTLAGIVFVFLVGELPQHVTSRKSAVTILYGGDSSKMPDAFMEKFRVWATVLNAISSSASFVLYCLLSPQFLAHLKDLVTCVRDDPRKNKLKNPEEQPSNIQRLESNVDVDL